MALPLVFDLHILHICWRKFGLQSPQIDLGLVSLEKGVDHSQPWIALRLVVDWSLSESAASRSLSAIILVKYFHQHDLPHLLLKLTTFLLLPFIDLVSSKIEESVILHQILNDHREIFAKGSDFGFEVFFQFADGRNEHGSANIQSYLEAARPGEEEQCAVLGSQLMVINEEHKLHHLSFTFLQ